MSHAANASALKTRTMMAKLDQGMVIPTHHSRN
jgi:hypothetical protein